MWGSYAFLKVTFSLCWQDKVFYMSYKTKSLSVPPFSSGKLFLPCNGLHQWLLTCNRELKVESKSKSPAQKVLRKNLHKICIHYDQMSGRLTAANGINFSTRNHTDFEGEKAKSTVFSIHWDCVVAWYISIGDTNDKIFKFKSNCKFFCPCKRLPELFFIPSNERK